MPRLFACIISPETQRDKASLIAVAKEFSYLIETLNDGILFDVSGLERLVGDKQAISRKIANALQLHNLRGSVALATTIDSACLLARQRRGSAKEVQSPKTNLSKLPLSDLPIEQDTLNVFTDLGLRKVEDLLLIPRSELIKRYGMDFRKIIDVIEEKSSSMLVPNVNERQAQWNYDLDLPVHDFEQLIFLLNHGFEKLFVAIQNIGLSTEHLDITFRLKGQPSKSYEIKTAFPTLERSFWLKFVNLRISLDPPDSEITAVSVTAHFTKSRPSQRGLYAASRPEQESLLLTINKLKKLVGEDSVGVPVFINQRVAEPFTLDTQKLPTGIESVQAEPKLPTLAFTYYRPPQRAEVVYRNNRLVFIRTRSFDGYVTEHSGVWKGNSFWWDKPWRTQEWDVEIENRGIYRLGKAQKEWFLLGEYD